MRVGSGGGAAEVAAHEAAADPHTQYLLVDGTRNGTGDWINVGDLTARVTAVGTGTSDGLVAENTTAAADGAQQYSPLSILRGSGWKTNATAESQAVEFATQVRPVQGAAAPTGGLHFLSQINGGGWTGLWQITSAGALECVTAARDIGGNTATTTVNQIRTTTLSARSGLGLTIAADSSASQGVVHTSSYTHTSGVRFMNRSVTTLTAASGDGLVVASDSQLTVNQTVSASGTVECHRSTLVETALLGAAYLYRGFAGATGVTEVFSVNNSGDVMIDGDINHDGDAVGFFGTAPAAKPTVVGTVADAVAGSILDALVALGLVTDGTS